MCKNVQKSFYGPCKTNGSESGRQFQRFYYEKTLVGLVGTPLWHAAFKEAKKVVASKETPAKQ